MFRFLLTPRWILFHLLVAAAMVAMINLGFWQLRRLDERRSFNDVIESRYDRQPVPLDELLAESGGDLDSVEWRPLRASGEFLPDEELRVVNRSQGGLAGDNVVTPLRLDDGGVLLVNRGFVPLGASPDELAPAPAGRVTVVGRAHPSDQRRRGQLTDAADGELTEVQRLDLDRLAPQMPGDLVPVYVDEVQDGGRQVAYPRPVAAPELTEGPHLGYAVQWFVFSTCAGIGWVLAVRRSAATRRHEGSVIRAET